MIYRGVCVNNVDPEGLMRITATVPQILGEAVSAWAWPCVPPGWPFVLQNHTGHSAGSHAQYTGDGSHAHTHTTIEAGKEHKATYPVPSPGDGVWIMFEGNDIEHPIWLGTWMRKV